LSPTRCRVAAVVADCRQLSRGLPALGGGVRLVAVTTAAGSRSWFAQRRVWLAVAGVVLSVALFRPAARYVRAAEFLSTLAGLGKTESRSPVRVTSEDLTIPSAAGPIRARLYFRSDHPRGPGVVVAHGVHYQGIDERRLVPFAQGLAREGLVVLTPELAELADYRITASGVGVVTTAVRYLASRRDHVEGPRVGLLGFSFAGGLSLVASALPELRGKLSFVTSVGGHQDLARVLHFLIHDEIATPRGLEHEKAHEYGLVVLVHQNIEAFVPAPDVPALGAAFKAWLEEDRPAARAFASQRTTAEGERLWSLLEAGKLNTLGPALDRILAAEQGELAALSPSGHLRSIDAPVYLLHGAHDSVIPPSETDFGDLELGTAPHGALVSPLIEHVEVSGAAGLRAKLELLTFMANLF
jgi:dienelactone hydrolase